MLAADHSARPKKLLSQRLTAHFGAQYDISETAALFPQRRSL
jgi:hypothetical protein